MAVNNKNRKKYLVIALAVSIVLHGIISYFFFNASFRQLFKQTLKSITPAILSTEQLQKTTADLKEQLAHIDKKPKIKAKMRAPKSSFGWVLFEKQPETAKTLVIPEGTDGTIGGSRSAHAGPSDTPVTSSATSENETVSKDTLQDDSLHKQSLEPTHAADQIQDTAAEPTQPNTQTVVTQLPATSMLSSITPQQSSLLSKEEELSNKIEKIRAYQQALENGGSLASLRKSILKKDIEQKAFNRVRGYSGKNQTKNIIALTKGYIEKIHGEEGDDPIDQDGQEGLRASVEEMKVAQYEAKVNWCLQATWKKYFARLEKWEPENEEGDAIIEFDITRHGKFLEVRLLKSTGSQALDRRILQTTEKTNPFPPAPKELCEGDVCTLFRCVNVFKYDHRSR